MTAQLGKSAAAVLVHDIRLRQQLVEHRSNQAVDLSTALCPTGDVDGGQARLPTVPVQRLDRGGGLTCEQL